MPSGHAIVSPAVYSFSRTRSLTPSENGYQPLVPCIVNANANANANPGASTTTTTTTTRRPHVRRPSLPLPPRPDLVTVPLRPCCAECYPITEECLREGVEWKEKFTRGARRRRNSSADMLAHAHAQRHRRVQDDVPGFEAVVLVDEVDKRHRVGGATHDMSVAPADDGETENDGEGERLLLPSLTRLRIADPSSSAKPRTETSAIAEANEDEDEEAGGASDTGFPLPSPTRRTTSPGASFSPLPPVPCDDDMRLLLQAMTDARAVEEFLLLHAGGTADGPRHDVCYAEEESGESGEGVNRASVYYTPDTSPVVPLLEPSSAASSPEEGPYTPSPRTPSPTAAPSRSTSTLGPIITAHALPPAEVHAKHSPVPHSPALSHHSSEFAFGLHDHRPPSLAYDAPFVHVVRAPAYTPASRPRRGLHAAGSFFRAGADLLKSVSSFGPGVPMAM